VNNSVRLDSSYNYYWVSVFESFKAEVLSLYLGFYERRTTHESHCEAKCRCRCFPLRGKCSPQLKCLGSDVAHFFHLHLFQYYHAIHMFKLQDDCLPVASVATVTYTNVTAQLSSSSIYYELFVFMQS